MLWSFDCGNRHCKHLPLVVVDNSMIQCWRCCRLTWPCCGVAIRWCLVLYRTNFNATMNMPLWYDLICILLCPTLHPKWLIWQVAVYQPTRLGLAEQQIPCSKPWANQGLAALPNRKNVIFLSRFAFSKSVNSVNSGPYRWLRLIINCFEVPHSQWSTTGILFSLNKG